MAKHERVDVHPRLAVDEGVHSQLPDSSAVPIDIAVWDGACGEGRFWIALIRNIDDSMIS